MLLQILAHVVVYTHLMCMDSTKWVHEYFGKFDPKLLESSELDAILKLIVPVQEQGEVLGAGFWMGFGRKL